VNKQQEAEKRLAADRRELKRDQQKWRSEQAELQGKNLQLTVSNRLLEKKHEKLKTQISGLESMLDSVKLHLEDVQGKVTQAGNQLDELESKRADKADELAELRRQVENRKATADKEVEEYAVAKKLAIKDDILVFNTELTEVREVHTDLSRQIDVKRKELADLNQAAIQEAFDLKLAHNTADQSLADKKTALAETTEQFDKAQEQLQKLLYKRDDAINTIKKAEDAHAKFKDYEIKARKILDAKDRELQEKAADISQQGQFLKNSRSFLAEL
jgi:chromosome segregation ATPase